MKHHRNYNKFLQIQIHDYQNTLDELQYIKNIRKTYFNYLQALSQLRKKQILTIKLFNLIVTILPKGAYFNEIEKNNSQVIFSRYAQNNKKITIFIQKTSMISWLNDPKLKIIANKQYRLVSYPWLQ